MTTIIQCPNCGAKYRLKFEIADGQQVRCPICKTVWQFQSQILASTAKPEQQAASADAGRYQGAAEHGRGLSQALAANTQRAASDIWSDSEAAEELSDPPSWMARSQDEDGSHFAARPNVDAGESFGKPFSGQGHVHGSHAYNRNEDEQETPGNDYAAGYRAYEYADERQQDRGELNAAEASAPGNGEDNWAAQLADAINRTGQLQAGAGREAQEAEFDGEDGRDSRQQGSNGEWSEDAERSAAADRFDAFWHSGTEQDDADSHRTASGDFAVQAGLAAERKTTASLAMTAAWGLYLTFAGGLVAAALTFRDSIVQAMPGAAHYYAKIGLPIPTEPLGFENVSYAWSERDGKPVLEVKGEVVNHTNASIAVPLLHITVRDDRAIDVANTVAVVVKEPLAGKSRANFLLEFSSPPKRISEIELRFRT